MIFASPPGLEKLLLADSISVSIEVACNIKFKYKRGRGVPGRNNIVIVWGIDYDNMLGDMAVCNLMWGMNSDFRNILPQNIFYKRPPCDPTYKIRE